jgi:hypothetical protein
MIGGNAKFHPLWTLPFRLMRLAMLRLRRLSTFVFYSVALACHAQITTPPDYSIERIGTECVTIDSYPVPVERGECTVVDFGQLTVVDGYAFHYARYQITAEVPFWPNLREIIPEANALIIFVGEEISEYVSVYRSYHENLSEFQRLSFPVPDVLDTAEGQVLHVKLRDTGDGMQQWFNDEYWIWRWNDWRKLDVTSWYSGLDAYIPSPYTVGGVSSDYFDLINLRNVSPVRKMDDPDCCPSAGIVTVSFEWVDLALTTRDVTYDPDTDFRSISR